MKLYRVNATGEIVKAIGHNFFASFEDIATRHYEPDDLKPVVAVPPNRVLPEGLVVVDTSGLVRRDGGPMPLAVLKLPKPLSGGETMLMLVDDSGFLSLHPDFRFLSDVDSKFDLIPKPAEPRYRPYANQEEAKHLFGQRLRWKDHEWLVYVVDDDAVNLSDGGVTRYVHYGYLLRSATMLDGTPCGVREDGS